MTGDVQQANLRLVRRFVDGYKTGGDESIADDFFDPSFVNHSTLPGIEPDLDGVKTLFRIMRAAFPDLHVDVEDMLADGDKVVTRQTFRGTHRGTYLGVAPTGRTVDWGVIDILRLRDGRATDHWSEANLVSLLEQIGGLPPGGFDASRSS
jgi:predicted ester cyclase